MLLIIHVHQYENWTWFYYFLSKTIYLKKNHIFDASVQKLEMILHNYISVIICKDSLFIYIHIQIIHILAFCSTVDIDDTL